MADKAKYGLLSYRNTGNIGDEIQSLAARQFLPQVDYLIDREELNQFSPGRDKRVWTILNGWYCHKPENWPPSNEIVPLLISLHISEQPSIFSGLSPVDAMLSEPAAHYLRGVGPVGARDLQTLRLLQGAGIDSYFSGCLTLTLQRPPVDREEDLIVVCDALDSTFDFVRKSTTKRVERVSHVAFHNPQADARFQFAESLLKLYARASCVVTTRLHCALPCVAMGTPVFLIDMAPDQDRFSGLHDFVRHAPIWIFNEGRSGFNIDNPGPNPDAHLPYRKALTKRATSFVRSAAEGQIPGEPLSTEQRLQVANLMVSRLAKAVSEKQHAAHP
jgi:Polysaccharide pyruvyl transferase